jgi:5'-nucleotidase
MNQRPHILITNDDGINAPGIRFLWQALREIAEITIVAPHTEQSAVGLGITIRTPLYLEKIDRFEESPAWSVSGTPVDCVKMGLSLLMKKKPDLIVSGLNRGSNAGRGVFYSGTVAGVIEGVLRDIPGIALSCVDFDMPDYEGAAKHVTAIVQHVQENPLPSGTLLNVNFPSGPIKGIKLTRQGKEYFMEDPTMRNHPFENQNYYWLGAKLAQFEEEEDSDIVWLRKGYIAAVPVFVGELTNSDHLASHRDRFEQLVSE